MYANDAYGMVFYNVLDATESGLVTLQAQPYSTSGERLEAQLVKVGPEGGRHHVKVGPEGGAAPQCHLVVRRAPRNNSSESLLSNALPSEYGPGGLGPWSRW